MTRTGQITDHLRTHITETLHSTVSVISREDFLSFPLQPQFRYGFMPPIMAEGRTVIVPICPEILAAAADGMDDHTFSEYLELVTFIITKHVALLDEIHDGCARHEAVLELIAAALPNHMALLMGAQARLLDDGVVPLGAGRGY